MRQSQNLLASGTATLNGRERAAPDLNVVMAEIAQSEQKSAKSPDFVSTPTSTGRLIECKEVRIWQNCMIGRIIHTHQSNLNKRQESKGDRKMRPMMRIKMAIPVVCAVLIVVALLALNSPVSKGATLGTLNNSEMSKIVGMCGCHTQLDDRGCTEGGSPPPQCGATCAAYNLAGANPNKCAWETPDNNAHCETTPNQVTCKTPYSCDTESKWMLKCNGALCKNGFVWDSCTKCQCKAGTPNKLDSFYCDG
jgi:hypothetical protein